MDLDANTKLAWETPAAVAITDTDSRADQADVAMRNGINSNPGLTDPRNTGVIVDIDATTRLPWETPAAVAITDADSRADQLDVAGQYLGPGTSIPN